MIYIDVKQLQDGLYNIKDGKIYKYKAKGGTVRTYKLENRPQGEWIPCSERLPELTIHENEPFIGEWDNSEPVLIYHKDNKYEYPYLIAQYTNGFENNEVGWTEMNDANEVIDVMAWMPLPEPWKGADDE